MSSRGACFGVAALLLALSGCGGSSPSPTAPATPSSPPPPPPPPPTAPGGPFRVAVLLSAARVPSTADVQRVFARAESLLFEKTGARMQLTGIASMDRATPLSLAVAYVNEHSDSPPDGVLVFSDDTNASTFGGYSQTFPLPPPHQNRYPSPVVGASRVYLAVAHFFHMYARCGYDDSGNRISSTSVGGECRNRPGMACVDNGRYWTCPDTLNDLYADPDHFTACTVVHEFMHPFGSEGNFDHYGTPQCIARTGMSQADAANLALAQQNCGMCPDVYARFPR
jgi:hypothetical protein